MAIWHCAKRSRQYTCDKVQLEFSCAGELRNALADIPADWDVYSDEEGNMFAESQGRPETDDEWKKRVDAEIAKLDSKFPAIVNPENVRYIMQRISEGQVVYRAGHHMLYQTAQDAAGALIAREVAKASEYRIKRFHVRAIEVHPNGAWNPVVGADELFLVRLGE